MFLEALRSFLLALPAVTGALGEPHAFYVGHVPPKVPRRYVVCHRVAEPGQHHLAGVSNRVRTAFQLESYADTRAAAMELDAVLQAAIDGYRGVLSDTVWCHELLKEDARGPIPIDLQDGDGHPAFVVQTDYHAWHSPRS